MGPGGQVFVFGVNDDPYYPLNMQHLMRKNLTLRAGITVDHARHLTEADALSCVAGYTIMNEGSVRDYQRKGAQWTMGKNFESTGGIGPEIVTPDEIPQGPNALRITSRLNGETMQDSNTSDMIFSVPRILAILSEAMTLVRELSTDDSPAFVNGVLGAVQRNKATILG